MNVIYDISHLGLGHSETGYKTGIFRAVDTLARQLMASKQCHLTFCATSYSLPSQDYASKTFPYSGVSFPRSGYKNLISVHLDRLHQASTPSVRSFPLRVMRKGLKLIDKTFGYEASPLSCRTLEQADVYHSTYYRLPRQVRQSKRLAKFLTVYDLIPILKPQYFDPMGGAQRIQFLDSAVRSLGNDGYALCISEATKADLCQYLNLDPGRVFVTYLAADAETFYPCHEPSANEAVRQKYGIPDGPFVLSLSTLAPHKNIEHVIRSFSRLVQEHGDDDFSLVLTGAKGWDYATIFREASVSQDLQPRIIFTGRVADEDLAALYSAALVFVYMSFYEGFGLPPLEAMQCGTPVITSNNSSLPEVVGEAGIMLDASDSDGLCQSILNVAKDGECRRSLSQKSLLRAQQFSWERCAQETIAAYRTAVAN